ncbi:MAG: DUF4065 domain-containing protein [Lachnospiraceae bacterium]|nr:DUF4065 domain-containing protein [Lachnospiraceae bacterium]
MKKWNLIEKINMECPLCDKIHIVEKRTRISKTIVKGEEVEYEEIYFYCANSADDECEFVSGRVQNDNLLNARNAYRVLHGLLTSYEIIAIRESYGLSQVDLAKLLGWGEATISRYESKAIQDEPYDNILKIMKENPLAVYEFLQKNECKFSDSKIFDIKRRIMANLNSYGREYLKRKALESEYIDFKEPCEANGNKTLDIDKLENIISYFAKKINYLYKVKLMKLLWYADALSYKLNGSSMTGLVYRHDDRGALPIGHYKIVGLENIIVKEEEDLEYIRYHFYPNDNLDGTCLSKDEIMILDKIIEKFKSYSTSSIVEYMHKETAYQMTKAGEIIPFSYAKEIKL